MIRDVTGLNEARDGSTPDKNALVGVQKLAAGQKKFYKKTTRLIHQKEKKVIIQDYKDQ